ADAAGRLGRRRLPAGHAGEAELEAVRRREVAQRGLRGHRVPEQGPRPVHGEWHALGRGCGADVTCGSPAPQRQGRAGDGGRRPGAGEVACAGEVTQARTTACALPRIVLPSNFAVTSTRAVPSSRTSATFAVNSTTAGASSGTTTGRVKRA